MKSEEDYLWWQSGIIYQVYPRSFQDTNGDGIGDIQGIIQRLDYLKWLGVDAVWISPIFPSPMADFGYDVADYTGIDPMFGTMDDFDELLAAAHERGLKIILDFVPNHTSEQHPWFIESRSSRDNPKRDWYLWRDPAEGGGEPNNWLSVFGGSAWEYDEKTGQYYYHAFLKEQPDLNWRNPEVQREMFKVMEFWLDKGVDGFRVDVIWHMIKDKYFRNNPRNPDYHDGMSPYSKHTPAYSTDQPEVHKIIEQMRHVIDRYDDRLFIGEIYLPVTQLVTYYGEELSGVHLPFNFQLIVLPWEPLRIYSVTNEYLASIPKGGWPNWVLGNHDKSRIASRVGREQAKIAAIMLLTLKGTPTMYYGDELGMEDVPIPREEIQDPHEKRVPDLGCGRDPERTPMQWNNSENAGFSTGRPWLRLAHDYQQYNVEKQKREPASFLNYYKRLLDLRRREPALSVGGFVPVAGDDQLIAYKRLYRDSAFLIIVNLSQREAEFNDAKTASGRIVFATAGEKEGAVFDGKTRLEPNEGLIIDLAAA